MPHNNQHLLSKKLHRVTSEGTTIRSPKCISGKIQTNILPNGGINDSNTVYFEPASISLSRKGTIDTGYYGENPKTNLNSQTDF